MLKKKKVVYTLDEDADAPPEIYPLDENISIKVHGPPFVPDPNKLLTNTSRDDNQVIFMDISVSGGAKIKTGGLTQPRLLGRLHFEMRYDLVPIACGNFLSLIAGDRGISLTDGIKYHYLGTKIHRVVKDGLFQGGGFIMPVIFALL